MAQRHFIYEIKGIRRTVPPNNWHENLLLSTNDNKKNDFLWTNEQEDSAP